MSMPVTLDLLGLGSVAVDDLVFVNDYPPPDTKTTVLSTERRCGGLTAMALITASRLGARCGYGGVLGEDEVSSFAIETMRKEGIYLGHLRRAASARTIRSFIVVDVNRQTRNIFADHREFIGASADWPPPEVIASAKVLFVDHLGLPGMVRAARLAKSFRRPIVADFERVSGPEFPELLNLVDHLIVSRNFAAKLTSEPDPAKAALKLWDNQRRVVIVTCGAEGGWWVQSSEAPEAKQFSAFNVEAADTTGCGDVFHGAYAAGLARGLELDDRIRSAAAAAAIKASRMGGPEGVPTRGEVEAFLESRAN